MWRREAGKEKKEQIRRVKGRRETGKDKKEQIRRRMTGRRDAEKNKKEQNIRMKGREIRALRTRLESLKTRAYRAGFRKILRSREVQKGSREMKFEGIEKKVEVRARKAHFRKERRGSLIEEGEELIKKVENRERLVSGLLDLYRRYTRRVSSEERKDSKVWYEKKKMLKKVKKKMLNLSDVTADEITEISKRIELYNWWLWDSIVKTYISTRRTRAIVTRLLTSKPSKNSITRIIQWPSLMSLGRPTCQYTKPLLIESGKTGARQIRSMRWIWNTGPYWYVSLNIYRKPGFERWIYKSRFWHDRINHTSGQRESEIIKKLSSTYKDQDVWITEKRLSEVRRESWLMWKRKWYGVGPIYKEQKYYTHTGERLRLECQSWLWITGFRNSLTDQTSQDTLESQDTEREQRGDIVGVHYSKTYQSATGVIPGYRIFIYKRRIREADRSGPVYEKLRRDLGYEQYIRDVSPRRVEEPRKVEPSAEEREARETVREIMEEWKKKGNWNLGMREVRSLTEEYDKKYK